MPTDLNSMNLPTGSEYEIFEPENAWPDASGRVVVQCNKMAGGTYQLGYDPESRTHWIRSYGGVWGEWVALEAPPPPPEADAEATAAEADDEDDGDEASDEYKTTDMKPKRGPGRPRKY